MGTFLAVEKTREGKPIFTTWSESETMAFRTVGTAIGNGIRVACGSVRRTVATTAGEAGSTGEQHLLQVLTKGLQAEHATVRDISGTAALL